MVIPNAKNYSTFFLFNSEKNHSVFSIDGRISLKWALSLWITIVIGTSRREHFKHFDIKKLFRRLHFTIAQNLIVVPSNHSSDQMLFLNVIWIIFTILCRRVVLLIVLCDEYYSHWKTKIFHSQYCDYRHHVVFFGIEFYIFIYIFIFTTYIRCQSAKYNTTS